MFNVCTFLSWVLRHFLNQYKHVNKCSVVLDRDLWTRVIVPDSKGRMSEHNHTFQKVGPQSTYCK